VSLPCLESLAAGVVPHLPETFGLREALRRAPASLGSRQWAMLRRCIRDRRFQVRQKHHVRHETSRGRDAGNVVDDHIFTALVKRASSCECPLLSLPLLFARYRSS